MKGQMDATRDIGRPNLIDLSGLESEGLNFASMSQRERWIRQPGFNSDIPGQIIRPCYNPLCEWCHSFITHGVQPSLEVF